MQWVDDLPVVNTYLLKQLRKLREDDQSSLNFPNIADKQEDIDFGKAFMRKSLLMKIVCNKSLRAKPPIGIKTASQP